MALDLNLVRAFVAVHDAGSFSLAAQKLGVPRSTVSRAIAALEEELNVALFRRTTRKVATTDAGMALYDRAAPSLAALESSLGNLPERGERPSGTLRVTATPDVATLLLAEAVTRYTARYPDVQVELLLSNRVVDLVRERFDLALRISIGALPSSTLIARKLGAVKFHLYASPAYLARAGTLRSPADLAKHELVAFRGAPALGLSRGGAAPRARVICDDMFFTRELLRNGAGIGALPSFVAAPDLGSNALTRVLPRVSAQTGSIYLVQPGRKHVPSKLTAFRDLLLELLLQHPL